MALDDEQHVGKSTGVIGHGLDTDQFAYYLCQIRCINKNFLGWDFRDQGGLLIDREIRFRAEILLERAESHIGTNKSKDSRADCLLTLKRALNHRLKAIEEIYEFRNLIYLIKIRVILSCWKKSESCAHFY